MSLFGLHMTRTFENPANGYREAISGGDSLAVALLGAIYLAFRGLWPHVFVWLLIVVLPSFAAPFFIFTVPILSICYALSIQGILANRYFARGWREVSEDATTSVTQRTTPAYISPAVRAPYKPLPSARKCPFCAEEIKAEAVKCKHCHSDLPLPT